MLKAIDVFKQLAPKRKTPLLRGLYMNVSPQSKFSFNLVVDFWYCFQISKNRFHFAVA
jgi:hypothetical protein